MKVCPKCFENNDDAAEFCVGCGAPLVDGGEGSDQAVYQDLARANLLRMRGDMKQANDVCLGILRRFPNNPTAHGLLGDIAADQGDLDQAATWYEMALDLNPDSSADKQKLDSVRERIHLKESAAAAQQIGIPEKSPSMAPFFAIVAVTVLAVAIGAYFMGKNMQTGTKPATIDTPVKIGQQAPVVEPKDTQDARQDTTPDEARPNEPAAQSVPQPDGAILNALHSQGQEKLDYIGVVEDPRGQSAILTVKEVEGEAPGVTATRAGLEFYSLFPAYSKVTLRVMGATGFVLVADLHQEAAKTAKAAISGGDTLENQSQVALSQSWTPPHTTSEGTTGG